MAVLLTVTQGPDQGKSLRLEAGRTYRIGCDSSDDLTLTDPMVLKGHCSLEVGGEGVILRNHTASAGTFVGEKKVARLWEQAEKLLKEAGANEVWVAKTVKDRSLEQLAEIVKTIF